MGTSNQARDIHSIEPEAILEFFEISYDPYASDQVFRFHGGMNLDSGGVAQNLVWNSQTYTAFPMESSDFEVAADQTTPRPKLRVSNNTFLISQILRRYNRLLNSKVTRRRIPLKYLDAINFPNSINPYGVPDSNQGFESEVFFVNRISEENKYFVTLELSSSLELENINLPNRQILARYCSWGYRDSKCRYAGAPKKTERDVDFTDANGSPITNLVSRGVWQEGVTYAVGEYVSRPTKIVYERGVNPNDVTYVQAYFVCRQAHTASANTNPFLNSLVWARDGCGKRLSSCRSHFSDGTVLSFGGFVGCSNFGG